MFIKRLMLHIQYSIVTIKSKIGDRMMPSLFLAHGSPMMALEDTGYTRFLQGLSKRFKQPTAVIVFSAHWETEEIEITTVNGENSILYDFYGFPEELYHMTYSSFGSVSLAHKIHALFHASNIKSHVGSTRGIDHGVWCLLHHIYPSLHVPLIQISVQPYQSSSYQFKIGEALRSLKKENVLIIGSGGTVHNLRALDFKHRTQVVDWAYAFDDWLTKKIEHNDREALKNYEKAAPYVELAVPRPEHYIPLYIAMGASEQHGSILHRSYDYGSLSYIAVEFP